MKKEELKQKIWEDFNRRNITFSLDATQKCILEDLFEKYTRERLYYIVDELKEKSDKYVQFQKIHYQSALFDICKIL